MPKLRVLIDSLLDTGRVGPSTGMSELQADYLVSCGLLMVLEEQPR